MAWITIENPRAIIDYKGGKPVAKLDLQVATAEDLPEIGDEVEGYIVAAGSIAQIIQADSPTFVTLDANGTWYPEQSDSSNSLNASLLSAPKNLGGGREEITDEPDVTDKTEKSILYPDEPELTEKDQPEMKKSEPTESEVTEDA